MDDQILKEDCDLYFLNQTLDRAETLSNTETPNSYVFLDSNRRVLLKIIEISAKSFRLPIPFLFGGRSFNFQIKASDDSCLLSLVKLSSFYFSGMDILDANGKKIAHINHKFKFGARYFEVLDLSGAIILTALSGITEPSTYRLRKVAVNVGSIHKKWSGIANELFSDADCYAIEIKKVLSDFDKLLCFSLALLIDMKFFEKKC